MQGMRIRSMVRALSSHMPRGQKISNRSNIATDSIKTLKWPTLKKKKSYVCHREVSCSWVSLPCTPPRFQIWSWGPCMCRRGPWMCWARGPAALRVPGCLWWAPARKPGDLVCFLLSHQRHPQATGLPWTWQLSPSPSSRPHSHAGPPCASTRHPRGDGRRCGRRRLDYCPPASVRGNNSILEPESPLEAPLPSPLLPGAKTPANWPSGHSVKGRRDSGQTRRQRLRCWQTPSSPGSDNIISCYI